MNDSSFRRIGILVILIGVMASCSPKPYVQTDRMHKKQLKALTQSLGEIPPRPVEGDTTGLIHQWVGTTNFNIRKPNFVIIHHTAQDSTAQTLRTFTLTRTSVSSHYVIGRDGEVVQMLNDYLRAWHAGVGKWGHNTDLNSSSIGIEMDNNGSEPFPEKQITSLLNLLERLKEDYGIPTANFIGHSDLAPSRKIDPSPHFPWKTLAENGFGLWYDDLWDPTYSDPLQEVPEHFNVREALRIIGYDTTDLKAAIRAFKIHFIQRDVNGELTEHDLQKLHNLYQKYL